VKVFMLTQGEYSSYEVVAIFTTQELAKGYALALATKEHEQGLLRSRESLERYDREGSSWVDQHIANVRLEWAARPVPIAEMERVIKEIRDSYRNRILEILKAREEPLVMEEGNGWYGYFQIEEQELYDMVPVVPSDD
jgi:hypothetical protein